MRRGDQLENVTISVVVTRATDKAVCVERRDGEELWVPLSVCCDDPPARGQRGELRLKGWWAHERGLESDAPDEGDEQDDEDPILAFSCPPPRRAAPRRQVRSPAFGLGVLVEERGDRVVADFPPPHGRKTVLRARVEVL